MSDLNDMESSLSAWSFDSGFSDILAIVRDGARETHLLATPASIRPQDIVSASGFRVDIDQKSVLDTRFAGEGADTNVIGLSKASVKSSFSMPFFAPAIGYIDPALATIWELARLAWWGTGSAAIGSLLNLSSPGSPVSAGENIIYTDNISDFAGLPLPIRIRIIGADGSGETPESLLVVSVSKATRSLNLSAPTAYLHIFGAQIVSTPTTTDGPYSDPAFSLLSSRGGMFAPSLINKVTINAVAGEPVKVEVEIMSLGVMRSAQIQYRQQQSSLLTACLNLPPTRIINGTGVTLSATSANAGTFGLSSAIGDPLFGGFQGLRLPPLVVTGISITIDNHLEEVWTAHSLKGWPQRQRENSFPQAIASNGRTVSGNLTYSNAIDPWIVTERLAGPSALNGGGLIINYGPCLVKLTEMAWQPSKADVKVEDIPGHTLDWTLVAETSDAMPRLEYAQQL